MTEISDIETRIRVFIYTCIAEFGAPPTAERIAAEMSMTADDARASLEALAVNRQVILHPTTREIWMAGPFSAVPTRFRVHGAKASYWANCAWDMLGIPASLGQSARIDATCADCDAPTRLEVGRDTGPITGEGLVHILLPANRWYADIGFT